MRTEILSDIASIQGLSDEWPDLLRESAADTLFMTWEWISAWLACQNDELEFVVVTVREEDRLLAVAPYFIRQYRLLGIIPVRVLCPIGITESGAEYPAIILTATEERKAIDQIAAGLRSIEKRWDLMWVPKVAAWTGAGNEIELLLQAGTWRYRLRAQKYSSIELAASYKEFLRRQTPRRRERISRYARIGTSEEYRVALVDDARILSEAVSSLISLHTRRWNSQQKPGSFAQRPRLVKFYNIFTETALECGWLRLYQLFKNERLVAAQIGYVYKNVFYQLQEAFDPEIGFGVGNVLRACVIQKCIEEGIREYDFLEGSSEHKKRWGAVERDGIDLLASGKTLLGSLILAAGIWPTGKYLSPT